MDIVITESLQNIIAGWIMLGFLLTVVTCIGVYVVATTINEIKKIGK